jgi:hypothetical protein
MLFLQKSRRDRDVAEETKPHRPIRLGMMPRRPHGGERAPDLAGHNRIATIQHRAAGEARDLKTFGTDGRITQIQHAAAGFADLSHEIDFMGRVNQPKDLFVGGSRGNLQKFFAADGGELQVEIEIRERIGRIDQPGFSHRQGDGADSIRPLGVIGAGVVENESRAGAESDH